ncbi:MAG: hypothetical protein WC980_05075 [Candidatus Brocadiia bacterium]
MEYGKCCRCGEDVGPYKGCEQDWLCKECYDRTHRRPPLPNPRMGGRRLTTAYEREQSMKWITEIDERLDAETTDKHR